MIETQHRDRVMAIFRAGDWEELGEGALKLEARRFDPVAGEMEADHVFIDRDGRRHGVTYRMRTYTATELARLVAEASFAQVDCFGSFEREPLSRDTRLVILAR